MNLSKRNYHLDNIKVFLILLVVIGHLFEPLIDKFPIIRAGYLFIYTFHMPCFIFITGYFTGQSSKNNIGKLIVQYLILQLIYLLFSRFILNNLDTAIQFTTPYWLLWFLLSLITWRILAPTIIKLRYPVIISLTIALLVGLDRTIGYYLSLSRTFVFLPYFIAGYTFKPARIQRLQNNLIKISAFITITFVGGYLILNNQTLNPSYLYHSLSYQEYGLSNLDGLLLRCLLLILGFVMTFAIIALVPSQKISCITNQGSKTFTIFIIHGFTIRWLGYIGFFNQFQSAKSALLLIPLGILISLILTFKPIQQLTQFISFPKIPWLYNNNQTP